MGDNVTITCSVTASGQSDMQMKWYSNGEHLVERLGISSSFSITTQIANRTWVSTLTLVGVYLNASGIYQCVVEPSEMMQTETNYITLTGSYSVISTSLLHVLGEYTCAIHFSYHEKQYNQTVTTERLAVCLTYNRVYINYKYKF